MNNIIKIGFIISVLWVLVISGFIGISNAQTENTNTVTDSSLQITSGIIEDFEDNDVNIDDENWSGWDSTNVGISTTEDSLSGDYSGIMVGDGSSDASIYSTMGNQQLNNFGTIIEVLNPGERTHIRLFNNDTIGVQIRLTESNDIDVVENGNNLIDTGADYSTNSTNYIEARQINYSNHTFRLFVNSVDLGRYSFRNDVNGFNRISYFVNTNNVGVKWDNVYTNSDEYNVSIEDLYEDYEDNDIYFNETGYGEFTGDTGGLHTTPNSIEGDYSLVIPASGQNIITTRITEPRNPQYSGFVFNVETGEEDDINYIARNEDDNIILNIKLNTLDGSVEVCGNRNPASCMDTVGNITSNRDTNFTVTYNWGANQYGVLLNGESTGGPYNFDQTSDGLQGITVENDYHGEGTRNMTIDTFTIGSNPPAEGYVTYTIGDYTIDNIGELPSQYWLLAILGIGEGGSFGLGSEMQWILLAIIFGATAGGVSRNEWVGNGVIIGLITLFWVMDGITLGIMLVSWTYGIFIMALIREVPSRTVIRKGGGGGGQQPPSPPNDFQ